MGGDPDPRGPAVALAWDAGGDERPDASTLDALCRLALDARRSGYRIRLLRASPELRELIELAGLTDVLDCAG